MKILALITVVLNGTPLDLSKNPPKLAKGNTGQVIMVPVRPLLEKMGAKVDWLYSLNYAKIEYKGTQIHIPKRQKFTYFQGYDVTRPSWSIQSKGPNPTYAPYPIYAPIEIHDNVMYVPVRSLSESLKFVIHFDSAKNTVLIDSNYKL